MVLMYIPLSSTILFLLAAALLTLSAYILFNYQRSQSIRYYAGFLLGLAIIAIAQAKLPLTENSATLLTITRVGYFGGVVTFTMLLMFSFFFPVPNKKSAVQQNLLWIIPLTFFVPVVFLSNTFLSSVTENAKGIQENQGTLFFLFPILIILYVFWTLKNLITKRGLTQGLSQPVGIFIWVLLIATTLGLIFDVLLPALGQPRLGIGIYSAIVLFGLSTYIVVKR